MKSRDRTISTASESTIFSTPGTMTRCLKCGRKSDNVPNSIFNTPQQLLTPNYNQGMKD